MRTWDGILFHILDAAARIKKRKDHLGPTQRDLRTRAQSAAVDVDPVGFPNSYCEMLHIWFSHIKLKLKEI